VVKQGGDDNAETAAFSSDHTESARLRIAAEWRHLFIFVSVLFSKGGPTHKRPVGGDLETQVSRWLCLGVVRLGFGKRGRSARQLHLKPNTERGEEASQARRS
jgi:hypothetical protein